MGEFDAGGFLKRSDVINSDAINAERIVLPAAQAGFEFGMDVGEVAHIGETGVRVFLLEVAVTVDAELLIGAHHVFVTVMLFMTNTTTNIINLHQLINEHQYINH